jgi:hypothetical protein
MGGDSQRPGLTGEMRTRRGREATPLARRGLAQLAAD